jgi:nucleoside 2-deoxyribosyltransferase
MDRCADNGETWRQRIKLDLSDLGIIWLDPTRKPTDRAIESAETRRLLAEAKEAGDFDYVCDQIKVIRSTDLRLTDVADFLVVHLDTEIYSCGTWEEIANANRQKKPIVVHVEQGKSATPNWLLGMIPHQMIFSTWEDLYVYLRSIARDQEFDRLNRWQFFSFQEQV